MELTRIPCFLTDMTCPINVAAFGPAMESTSYSRLLVTG